MKIIEKLKNLNPISKIKSKKIRVVIYIILILAILILPGIIFKPDTTKSNYEEAKVSKGDINVIISGSGSIEPNNKYELVSVVKGEILSDYFEEGQIVAKDDLLYMIDSKDVQNNIDRAKLSVERSQASYQQALDNSSITAASTGVITTLDLRVGQLISAGTKIAEIYDNKQMKLVLEYNYIDAQKMYVGQTVDVIVENGFYQISGKISKISSSYLTDANGMGISYVEVMVNNPGNLKDTDYAIGIINRITSNKSNKFEYTSKSIVIAKSSGYIKNVNKLMGDFVNKGDIIATIGSETLDTQVEQAKLQLQDSQLALINAEDQLKNYNIKSPVSGKVILKNNKKGDFLDSSTAQSKNVLAVIADMNNISFTMKVDELEISKVVKGQSVLVTADAIEGKTFIGKVDNINIVGSAENGVTSYTIKVVVENPDGLLPGMNVDSEIQIISLKDVLRVPLSAVQRGNIVYVKAADANYQESDTAIPKGFKKINVETGKNDKDNIEIISGLKENDVILIKRLTESATLNIFSGGGGRPSGNTETRIDSVQDEKTQ